MFSYKSLKTKKQFKENKTFNKGITLIALIITIVVLLILATVTIKGINDGGIIKHAEDVKLKYEIEQEKENISLAQTEWIIVKGDDKNTKTFKSFMGERLADSIRNLDGVQGEDSGPLIITMKSERKYKVEQPNIIIPVEKGILLSANALTIEPGATETITATLIDIVGEITWESSRSDIATIQVADNGLTTSIMINPEAEVGTEVDITATCGEYSGTCKVTIAETKKVDEDLDLIKKYFLETENLYSVTEGYDFTKLKDDPNSITDASKSITSLQGNGYSRLKYEYERKNENKTEVVEIDAMSKFFKYNNKVYLLIADMLELKWVDALLIYNEDPNSYEGKTFIFNFDGQDREWTVLYENEKSVDMVCKDIIGNTLQLHKSFSSEFQEAIANYNNAVNIINDKCNEIIINRSIVESVRSLGTSGKTDDSGMFDNIDLLTSWDLAEYNNILRNYDNNWIEDMARFYDFIGTTNNNFNFFIASRYMENDNDDIRFFVRANRNGNTIDGGSYGIVVLNSEGRIEAGNGLTDATYIEEGAYVRPVVRISKSDLPQPIE